MKKNTKIMLTAGVVFILALLFTVYPLLSSAYNERHKSEIHTRYQEAMAQTDDSAKKDAIAAAMAYNANLIPGVQDDAAFSGGAMEDAAVGYGELLNLSGDGIMGYVRIPQIRCTIPIYHGTSDDTLEVGVGHLLGSSLPVGGKGSHAIITGHSGMASNRMFSDLSLLKLEDIFLLEVCGETLAYQVDQIKTVLPHDTTYLGIDPEQDYVTLVTCTPFGVNTHRLLVRGTRIPYEPETETQIAEQMQKTESSDWTKQYLNGILIGFAVVATAAGSVGSYWLFRKIRMRGRHEDS